MLRLISGGKKGSPNYLLPDFINNKPIDTSYKRHGFGSYEEGAVKRFSGGGPAAGSALAANFGSGKGGVWQSLSKYADVWILYSGQAESVAIQEDVDAMSKILREEKSEKNGSIAEKNEKESSQESTH